MVNTIFFNKFPKVPDQCTVNSIYDSQVKTCDGYERVKEAKVEILIQQCELFKMKDDEDIKTMFLRFKFCFQDLNSLTRVILL